MKYSELKIEEFLQKLSSTDSMPGGGVASSLVAANGVSCALKVCNLSLGKEKYKEHEDLIRKSIKELEKYREKFFDLMDEDAKKFKAMEEVYKMPRETDEEKEKRKEALETACKICCEVPVKVLNEAAMAAVVITRLFGKTNVSAESDLKVAMMFMTTAIHAAWENVAINLKYIYDEEFKKKVLEIKSEIDKISDSLELKER